MKKKNFLLLLALCVFADGSAQSFDEWFEQNKTQLRYLRQQINALDAYLQTSEEGDSMLSSQLAELTQIKTDDLQQHAAYLASLRTVNPSVLGSPAIGTIRARFRQIDLIASDVTWNITHPQSGQESVKSRFPDIADLMTSFFTNLMEECTGDAEVTDALITDDDWELEDAERLEELDRIVKRMDRRLSAATQMQNCFTFLASTTAH